MKTKHALCLLTHAEQTCVHAQGNSSSPLAAPPEPLTADAKQSTHALAFVPRLSHQHRRVVTQPFHSFWPRFLTFLPEKLTCNFGSIVLAADFSNYNHNVVWTFPWRPQFSTLWMYIVSKSTYMWYKMIWWFYLYTPMCLNRTWFS